MKVESYVQCEMRKANNVFCVAWIPKRFAVIGKHIRFKENDIWSDWWEVKNVFNVRILKDIEERERDYKKFSYGKKKHE